MNPELPDSLWQRLRRLLSAIKRRIDHWLGWTRPISMPPVEPPPVPRPPRAPDPAGADEPSPGEATGSTVHTVEGAPQAARTIADTVDSHSETGIKSDSKHLHTGLSQRSDQHGVTVQCRAESAHAPTGRLLVAPWATPQRNIFIHVPDTRPSALLVLLHGCRQTPDEHLAGSGLAALAASGRWIILQPEQNHTANPYGCWNWFDAHTVAGGGETAIVLAAIASVAERHGIAPSATCIAGMSSGAGLAATLVCHAPERFAAAAFHSGLAMGASSSALRARRVMSHGPDGDVTTGIARRGSVPSLIVHGTSDTVVIPGHADELVRQMLTLDGTLAPGSALPAPSPSHPALLDALDALATTGRHPTRMRQFGNHAQVLVDGMGHAWSGGDATLPWNDADGPDASRMMTRFFEFWVDAVPTNRRSAPARDTGFIRAV